MNVSEKCYKLIEELESRRVYQITVNKLKAAIISFCGVQRTELKTYLDFMENTELIRPIGNAIFIIQYDKLNKQHSDPLAFLVMEEKEKEEAALETKRRLKKLAKAKRGK